MTSLAPQDEARARGRAFVLMADLFSRGPCAALLEPARASSVLDLALNAYSDLEAAEVAHESCFGRSVPLLLGTYLDPEGNAGSTVAFLAHEWFASIGFHPDPTKEEAEHLSTLLRAMAQLCGAEADALEDDAHRAVELVRGLMAQGYAQLILPGLVDLLPAVRRTELTWPIAMADQLEALVELHCSTLTFESVAELASDEGALELNDASLADIARYFTTTARSGFFVSHDDLAALAHRYRVPKGFGTRWMMLENLFVSASRFEIWKELLSELERLSKSDGPGSDLLQPYWEASHGRRERTRSMIADLSLQSARFESQQETFQAKEV